MSNVAVGGCCADWEVVPEPEDMAVQLGVPVVPERKIQLSVSNVAVDGSCADFVEVAPEPEDVTVQPGAPVVPERKIQLPPDQVRLVPPSVLHVSIVLRSGQRAEAGRNDCEEEDGKENDGEESYDGKEDDGLLLRGDLQWSPQLGRYKRIPQLGRYGRIPVGSVRGPPLCSVLL